MAKNILVRGARQLLTLHGPPGPRRGADLRNIGIIEDGSVLIVNGLVARVGPTRSVENLAEARNAEEIDATGRVVMPAFVDSNTQLLENGRAAGSSTGAGGDERRRPNIRRLDAEARRILSSCVRHGSGTLDARSGCGTDEGTELRMLRAAANLDQQAANVVPTYSLPATESSRRVDGLTYLEWLDQSLMPRMRAKRLTRLATIDCAADKRAADETRRFIEVCQRHDLIVRLHCQETHAAGLVPLAINSHVLAIEGLSRIGDSDAAALAASPVLATLLPGQTLQGDVPPARMMIDAGVAVALASGFRQHRSGTFNMQTVVALACTRLGMTAAEAITAATINGAHALQMGDRVGSLEFGRDADLLILGVSDYRELSWYFGVNLVSLGMRRGKVVYRESQVQWPAA